MKGTSEETRRGATLCRRTWLTSVNTSINARARVRRGGLADPCRLRPGSRAGRNHCPGGGCAHHGAQAGRADDARPRPPPLPRPRPPPPLHAAAAPTTAAAAAPKPAASIKINGNLAIIQQRGFNPLQTTYIHDLLVKTADANNWPLDHSYEDAFTGGGNFLEKMAATVAAGDSPDLLFGDEDTFQLWNQKSLQPVDDVVNWAVEQFGNASAGPQARQLH